MKQRNTFKRMVAASVILITLAVTMGSGAARRTIAPAGLRVPVIMYHHLLKDTSKLGRYTISPAMFESDLKYLQEHGYESVSIGQLVDHAETGAPLPEKPVVLTFDDGYESFYSYAWPLLKQYGFKATVSVIGVFSEQFSSNPDHNINYSYVTWEEVAEMASDGSVEIACHSYDMHRQAGPRRGARRMKGETAQQYHAALAADIERFQAQLESYMGARAVIYTYPFGYISEDALPVLKELGFKAALTCYEKPNYFTGSKEELFSIMRFNRTPNKDVAELVGHE
ncbi:MAG TPA: polysaccharide deacetylase family protein [Terriglobales bacterium]|nr:polysaccharide deacetylase family protein [Terriglobales bacterium]